MLAESITEIEGLYIDDVVYYSYYGPCPVCRRYREVTTSNYEWTHYGCGGKIMVEDNAMVLCTKCGHTHPVVTTK
ncbi:hypothetical protein [Porphyromonas gulae]|uniref:hypothetical protein n=1 Tax=Porphyromonas gulae TaxID=111105 RepID=UPI000AA9093F|nr:hypothetical protein [Porphyromonas gulae]